MNYSRISCDLVLNEEYVFYKLVINGKCQFDEFLCEIEKNVQRAKSFKSIIALMDSFSASRKLPDTKFRYIHSRYRSDIYEFKKNDIRVYVIKDKSDITIAMGGYKQNQKKDLQKLDRDLKDYPKTN